MTSPNANPARVRPPTNEPAHHAAEARDWPAYYDRVAGDPPRATLLGALDRFDAEPSADASEQSLLALDLACGDGRDTQALLERGWRVVATDPEPDALARLRGRDLCAQALSSGTLELRETPFERFRAGDFPSANLVNASFALPFCPPAHFGALWAQIDTLVRPGGRFAGQLFGDRDSWSILEDRTHLTRDQVIALFDGWVLESFNEEDRPSRHKGAAHKHWHVFHIVARKRTEHA